MNVIRFLYKLGQLGDRTENTLVELDPDGRAKGTLRVQDSIIGMSSLGSLSLLTPPTFFPQWKRGWGVKPQARAKGL